MTYTISLKQFIAQEAVAFETTPHAIEMRIARGGYPHLKRRRNSRFVTVPVPEKERDRLMYALRTMHPNWSAAVLTRETKRRLAKV